MIIRRKAEKFIRQLQIISFIVLSVLLWSSSVSFGWPPPCVWDCMQECASDNVCMCKCINKNCYDVPDTDGDSWLDRTPAYQPDPVECADNCQSIYNPDQLDSNGDG